MTNEHLKHELSTLMEGLHGHIRDIAEVHRRRSELTGTASAHDKRITVTVDADGILTHIRFADDIGDLTYDEIAAALTRTVQSAALDAARSMRELVQPLMDRRAHRPKLSDLLAGVMDLPGHIPGASRAPVSPPGAPDRSADPDPVGVPADSRGSIVADRD